MSEKSTSNQTGKHSTYHVLPRFGPQAGKPEIPGVLTPYALAKTFVMRELCPLKNNICARYIGGDGGYRRLTKKERDEFHRQAELLGGLKLSVQPERLVQTDSPDPCI